MSDLPVHGERAVLVEYLGHFRATFERQLGGLDAAQLALRSVPPSTLSLLGLLRHLGAVEYSWWRRVMERRLDRPRMWGKDDRPDADFDDVPRDPADVDPAMVEEAWATWRAEVAHGEAFVQAAASLEVLGDVDGQDVELREVLVHLVEEYARHCGHADLLRECIDGRTGL